MNNPLNLIFKYILFHITKLSFNIVLLKNKIKKLSLIILKYPFIWKESNNYSWTNIFFKFAKILEVGCGECRLINRLKQSHQLQKIIGIDMCRSSLENNFFKLKPLSWDFIQRRKQPLLIELYLGDILKLTKEFSKSLEHQILILTEV